MIITLTTCMISGNSLKFSDLKLSHLSNGHNNTYMRYECKDTYKQPLCNHSRNGAPFHLPLPSIFLLVSIWSVLPAFGFVITLPRGVLNFSHGSVLGERIEIERSFCKQSSIKLIDLKLITNHSNNSK